MNKRSTEQFLFSTANIIVPLFIGSTFYYISSPNVWFVRRIDEFLGFSMHPLHCTNLFCRILRCYVLDMLWAYALIFTLSAIMKEKRNGGIHTLFIAFFFSTALELLQLTDFISGTFDICDIALELLAEILAYWLIKKHNRRYKGYEKNENFDGTS